MGEQVAAGLNGGVAQLGEHLPCKQGVKSSNLSVSTGLPEKGSKDKNPYLENRILKIILKYQRLKSWFVRTNRIEEDKREDIQNKQKRNEDFK